MEKNKFLEGMLIKAGKFKIPGTNDIYYPYVMSTVTNIKNTASKYFGFNGIKQFNPSIINGKALSTIDDYLRTLSNGYIDELASANPSMFAGKDINLIKQEMGKLRDLIESTKSAARQASGGTASSFERWEVENCAEIWAVRNAILDGVKVENMVIRSANYSDGAFKILCENCKRTFKELILAGD